MKIPLKIFFFFLLLLGFNACSSTNGIDDYFTFNLQASQGVTLDKSLFTHQPVTVPVSILIDSAALGENGTNLDLVKSVKLNLLKLVSSDVSYPFSKIDTLTLSVQADGIGSEALAYYSGANDKVTYTDADFVQYIKGKNVTFMLSLSTSKPPAASFSFTISTINVLTARPRP